MQVGGSHNDELIKELATLKTNHSQKVQTMGVWHSVCMYLRLGCVWVQAMGVWHSVCMYLRLGCVCVGTSYGGVAQCVYVSQTGMCVCVCVCVCDDRLTK